MDISIKKFEQAKEQAEVFYKKIGEVPCPYLHANVAFNAKGLEHLKFKKRKTARSHEDQYIRFRLLELAPKIIEKSCTLQEYSETKRFEKVNSNSKWNRRMVDVSYYGFIAIIKGSRIKIIVKQVENGKYFFWSIIPFWKNNKKNQTTKKVLYSGDLDTD